MPENPLRGKEVPSSRPIKRRVSGDLNRMISLSTLAAILILAWAAYTRGRIDGYRAGSAARDAEWIETIKPKMEEYRRDTIDELMRFGLGKTK